MMAALNSTNDFKVQFGGLPPSADTLAVSIPVLAGETQETLFRGAKFFGLSEGFQMFQQGDFLIGSMVEPVQADLGGQTRRVYERLLRVAEGRYLARIWNYVPKINALSAEGMENYRAFCAGRSQAFEAGLGADCHGKLPSASAVGGPAGELVVIFATTSHRPRHVENPEQVPAYDYPPEHGPRAPSFARATRAENAGWPWVFVSGTAAIKGHTTIAPGDLGGQIDCMVDNFKIISRGCELGENLGAGGGWERHFKIYLRHPRDYEPAAAALAGRLVLPGDHVIWLHTDICRAALLIEVEATLIAVR